VRPLPTLRLVAPERGHSVLHLRQRVEHVLHSRSVPGVPPPVDFDPVPLVQPVVAAFALVCAVTKPLERWIPRKQ